MVGSSVDGLIHPSVPWALLMLPPQSILCPPSCTQRLPWCGWCWRSYRAQDPTGTLLPYAHMGAQKQGSVAGVCVWGQKGACRDSRRLRSGRIVLDGNSDLGTKRIGRTVVHGMGLFVKIRDPVQHDSPAPYSVTWWKEGVLSGYTGKKRGRACACVVWGYS